MDLTEFWAGHHATTEHDRIDRRPERYVDARVRAWTATDDVLDYGCGRGRLAPCFDPSGYIGIDINCGVIREARTRFPNHRFEVESETLPRRTLGLASFVLHHIEDARVAGVMQRLASAVSRLVLVECIGRQYRTAFSANRDLAEYVELGASVGWRRCQVIESWPSDFDPSTYITALRLSR